MRLGSFLANGAVGFGLVADGEVLDVATLAPLREARGLAEALSVMDPRELAGLARSSGLRHPLDTVRLLPSVTDAQRIMCVGMNYKGHLAELNLPMPDHPSIFVRFASSFVGHGTPIVAPRISEQFDFEGEIALVIGKAGYRIARSNVMDHVLGLTILTDNSVRDWQAHARQATAGKNFPSTGAIGPWIATLDEIADPHAVSLVTRLNGQLVQDASTSDLIFGIEDVIAYASSFTPLAPGDVIALGTPSGVGMGRKPPLWLKPGDRLEIQVEGIGVLSNDVVAEES